MDDTYTFDKLAGEPIILSVVTEDWRLPDLEGVIDKLENLLDTSDVPLFFISDLTNIRVSLEDVIQTVSIATRGSAPVLHHPMSKALLVITQSKMLEMSALGMRSKVFGGGIKTYVFKTQKEALAFAREYSDKSLPDV